MEPDGPLIACDPDLRNPGLAVFCKTWDDAWEMAVAGVALNPEKTRRGPRAWVEAAQAVKSWMLVYCPFPASLVIEMPVIRQAGHQKGRQSDIAELIGVTGAIASLFPAKRVHHYAPHAWKGTMAKEKFSKRIEANIRPGEAAHILKHPASMHSEVIDAIGLGFVHIGRLNVFGAHGV